MPCDTVVSVQVRYIESDLLDSQGCQPQRECVNVRQKGVGEGQWPASQPWVALEIEEYEWHPEEIKHGLLFALRVSLLPPVSSRTTTVQFMKESNQGEHEKGRLPSVLSALQQWHRHKGTELTEGDMSLIGRKTIRSFLSAS